MQLFFRRSVHCSPCALDWRFWETEWAEYFTARSRQMGVWTANFHSCFCWQAGYFRHAIKYWWFWFVSALVAQPAQKLGDGPKNWGGKMLDFRRITLFCLEKRLSKHKMAIFSKNLRGHGPFGPPWLRLATPMFRITSNFLQQRIVKCHFQV